MPPDDDQPECICMLLCDAVVTDPITRKKTYVGEVRHLHAQKLPVDYPLIEAHATVTNLGAGCQFFFAAFNESQGLKGKAVMQSDTRFLASDDPTAEIDFDTHLRHMTFHVPGVYRFVLFAGEVPIASRRILLTTAKNPPATPAKTRPDRA